MTTPPLPQETIERIHKNAYYFGQKRLETGYSTTISGQKEAYLQGANTEAKKALPLIEALKTLRKFQFKDSESVNDFIDETLNNYNNQK